MYPAKLGDRVSVQFTRVRKQSSAAATSPAAKQLEFTIGSDGVIPGLNLGVVGMVPGEQKRLTLQPSDAYGPVQPGLIKEIPRAQFPKRLTLRVGKRLTALGGASGRRRVRVVEIRPKSVVVDGNHVLAGKVVELDVTLVSVAAPADASCSAAQPAGRNTAQPAGRNTAQCDAR